jgi:hypothetical protein
MFESFAQIFPTEWQGAVMLLVAPLRWLAGQQETVVQLFVKSGSPLVISLLVAGLALPGIAFSAAMWCTMLSMYTIPFRSGRGRFITTILMGWWDAARCTWLFWTGIGRVAVALVGWIIGSVKFFLLMIRNMLVGLVKSPLTILDWSSRRYFKPGVPWVALMVLVLWTAVEATVFTFTLQPTLNEVFGGLTGFEPNPRIMAPLLWVFLFMLVAGSFACVQVFSEALRDKKRAAIVQMLLVESAVMFFEVIFLYRELIDAITPWIAQQSGGQVQLGIGATLLLASFGWVGVRGMSWFLFGRFGTPALIAILSRQSIAADGSPMRGPETMSADMWKGPISALKAETAWFHAEAKRMFELLSLPVLQLLAAALNFAIIVVHGRTAFTLPFKSLDDMLAAAPFSGSAKELKAERKFGAGMRTPRDPMPRVAS